MSKALGYAALVGQRGTMRVEQLTILVRIADAKDGGWGRDLYLVEPVHGGGQQWVEAKRIQLRED